MEFQAYFLFVVDVVNYIVFDEWYNKVLFSDLHEETCQQGSLNVDGVGSGTEGGHRHGQLDPLQSVAQLSTKSVSHQQSSVV